MVSNKGSKFSYSEGEKVLCYEPDPNKAKVLYDSKILECRTAVPSSVSSDLTPSTKGTKCDYLVHFSGWNSSWDRVVTEDNILKDTPENRSLQRLLAEEAANGLKNKKIKMNKIPAIIKEVINSASQDGSYSIEFTSGDFQECRDDALSSDGEQFDELKMGSSSSSSSGHLAPSVTNESEKTSSVSNPLTGVSMVGPPAEIASITWTQMPEALKKLLESDQRTIVDQNKLYQLPATITIIDILQQFIESVQKGSPSDLIPNYNKKSNVTRSSTSTVSRVYTDLQQLVIEFANSIEIYVNAIATTHLCYNSSEKDDILKCCEQNSPKKPSAILGFVHLLRFLVTLPEFVKSSSMTKSHVQHILSIMECFYFFLTNKLDSFHVMTCK